jgi:hypothetical protein
MSTVGCGLQVVSELRENRQSRIDQEEGIIR